MLVALRDVDDYVRQEACKSLGQMGKKAATKDVVAALVTTLSDVNVWVRHKAYEALGSISAKVATNDVIVSLVAAVGATSVGVRKLACALLGEIGLEAATNDVIAALVTALEDVNTNVRQRACVALGQIFQKAARNDVIAALMIALGNTDNIVKIEACKVLGRLGEKAATRDVLVALVTALGSPDGWTRQSACVALGQIGKKATTNDVIAALVIALRDVNDYMRQEACKALSQMGEKAATNDVIAALVIVLRDVNDHVRQEACKVLGQMGEKAATNDVIAALVIALSDVNEHVRQEACKVLGQMGEKPLTKKQNLSECRICGAILCNSCKMFFKRNANIKQEAFTCNFDGYCEIKRDNHHMCAPCRLRKCFQYGMTTNKFRPSRPTKSLVKIEPRYQSEKLSILNSLKPNHSLLTTSQWTLLSNLYNTFDESQLSLLGKTLVDTHNSLQPMNVTYQKLVENFLLSLYETAGRYLRLNDDICKLSFTERSIVLRNAADSVPCMACAFIIHHYDLFSLDSFFKILTTIYGKGPVSLSVWTMKFIISDIVIFKLALSLFALSKVAYVYSPDISIDSPNSSTLFHIQNKYAEVTWKYLNFRYGWYEAVKHFHNIIHCLMACTMLMAPIQNYSIHVDNVDSLVELTELTLILDDVEEIIETK
ncbi:unnamed protein product [Adineta steineri]|uniref:Nuclear receptor domain-containing protein n=1 Tax=Adineta steineri TaxID=433720 RepID=A0A819FXI6_9BILA|nr:unnamed protein product [Adineta steineri]CAF3875778.1 unnamed protein product [Adineta steineri]